jgi:hypothetical protein
MPPPEPVIPPACQSMYDKVKSLCTGGGVPDSQACTDARDPLIACVRNPPDAPGPAPVGSSTSSRDLGKGATSPPSDGSIPEPAD